jgi:metal-responsive CopG/Arc/MetJ family transcriptional regulator
MKKIISISLERELIDVIDERKGLISRSQFIETLLLHRVGSEEEKKEGVVMGYA